MVRQYLRVDGFFSLSLISQCEKLAQLRLRGLILRSCDESIGALQDQLGAGFSAADADHSAPPRVRLCASQKLLLPTSVIA
jgi:hypothetical protein